MAESILNSLPDASTTRTQRQNNTPGEVREFEESGDAFLNALGGELDVLLEEAEEIEKEAEREAAIQAIATQSTQGTPETTEAAAAQGATEASESKVDSRGNPVLDTGGNDIL